MIEIFTQKQEKAIKEKVEQLRKVKEGILLPKELANMITQRRLNWLNHNEHLLRDGLISPEEAYKLLIYHHMKVEEGITIRKISNNLMMAEARNFCPYLEACQRLEMDTKFVCKEIGEPSIIAFMEEISPKLHFFRDYSKIRPYSDHCLEFVEENSK